MKKPFWTFIIAGAWVFFSPWILGFASINLALWSNMLLGIIIVGSAIGYFGLPRD